MASPTSYTGKCNSQCLKEIINDYYVTERLHTASHARRLVCVITTYKISTIGYIFDVCAKVFEATNFDLLVL